MEVTQVEKKIILILREFIPHEKVEVIKDQTGKMDTYLIHRSQKIVIKPTDEDKE